MCRHGLDENKHRFGSTRACVFRPETITSINSVAAVIGLNRNKKGKKPIKRTQKTIAANRSLYVPMEKAQKNVANGLHCDVKE